MAILVVLVTTDPDIVEQRYQCLTNWKQAMHQMGIAKEELIQIIYHTLMLAKVGSIQQATNIANSLLVNQENAQVDFWTVPFWKCLVACVLIGDQTPFPIPLSKECAELVLEKLKATGEQGQQG